MANETRQSGPRGHGPGMRGGYQKPKDARKTALRLLSYVTGRPALLALVLLCLLISVGTNLAGSYMLRPIINDFVYTGASDVLGLGLSLVKLLASISWGRRRPMSRWPPWSACPSGAATACAGSSLSGSRTCPCPTLTSIPTGSS